jgi:hypothetical protein
MSAEAGRRNEEGPIPVADLHAGRYELVLDGSPVVSAAEVDAEEARAPQSVLQGLSAQALATIFQSRAAKFDPLGIVGSASEAKSLAAERVVPTAGQLRSALSQLPWRHDLWAHLHREHGLILTADELHQIVRLVRAGDAEVRAGVLPELLPALAAASGCDVESLRRTCPHVDYTPDEWAALWMARGILEGHTRDLSGDAPAAAMGSFPAAFAELERLLLEHERCLCEEERAEMLRVLAGKLLALKEAVLRAAEIWAERRAA